ncbi:twin-arginine translocase subunit TatC [Actinomycetaceae bacterium MB13-C1-2]|nr:twin-arginine translocase subunit TatC [Actinomycetaceae bacterium MB13-C1-2]
MNKRREDNPEAVMTLSGHLSELRRRLVYALVGIGIGAVGGWFLYEPIMAFIQEPLRNFDAAELQLNFQTIGAAFDLKLRIALWAGVIIASPWWIYQLGAFIAPGLKKRERIYVLAFGLVGVLLFAAGASSGVWMAPRAVEILQSFSPEGSLNLLQASDYVSFYLHLVMWFGVSFLLPEILVALNFAGVLSSKKMLNGWRWAVVIAFGFAAIANPLPSPWPMIVQAFVLIGLYLIAVLVSWLRERNIHKRDEGRVKG